MSKAMKNENISEATFTYSVKACAIACGARCHKSGFITMARKVPDEQLAQLSTFTPLCFMRVCVCRCVFEPEDTYEWSVA